MHIDTPNYTQTQDQPPLTTEKLPMESRISPFKKSLQQDRYLGFGFTKQVSCWVFGEMTMDRIRHLKDTTAAINLLCSAVFCGSLRIRDPTPHRFVTSFPPDPRSSTLGLRNMHANTSGKFHRPTCKHMQFEPFEKFKCIGFSRTFLISTMVAHSYLPA